jgi:hypothetical protein
VGPVEAELSRLAELHAGAEADMRHARVVDFTALCVLQANRQDGQDGGQCTSYNTMSNSRSAHAAAYT